MVKHSVRCGRGESACGYGIVPRAGFFVLPIRSSFPGRRPFLAAGKNGGFAGCAQKEGGKANEPDRKNERKETKFLIVIIKIVGNWKPCDMEIMEFHIRGRKGDCTCAPRKEKRRQGGRCDMEYEDETEQSVALPRIEKSEAVQKLCNQENPPPSTEVQSSRIKITQCRNHF